MAAQGEEIDVISTTKLFSCRRELEQTKICVKSKGEPIIRDKFLLHSQKVKPIQLRQGEASFS